MRISPILSVLSAAFLAQAAIAEEAVKPRDERLEGKLSLELNAAQSGEGGCMLTFVVINGHDADIARAVYETVLFDKAGQVDRLTLFDFGQLPAKRPRVRQFSVSGTPCDGLGQILVNGAHACEAAALDEGACEAGLEVTSRTEIEVLG